jgi:hypothetical protein
MRARKVASTDVSRVPEGGETAGSAKSSDVKPAIERSTFQRVRGGSRASGQRKLSVGRRVAIAVGAGAMGLSSIPLLAHHPGVLPTPTPTTTTTTTTTTIVEPPLPPPPPPPADPALSAFREIHKNWSEPMPGVRYLEFTAAGPHHVHVVEIDLSRPEFQLRTTRPDERGQTVSNFAQNIGALVAINGDFFEYGSYQPWGLAAGQGQHWAGTADEPSWLFLACDALKHCTIDQDGRAAGMDPNWTSVVGGAGAPLLVNGAAVARGDPPHAIERHPRSAVGLTDDHKMILVAAEGRRGDAIGMTYDEMSTILAEMRATTGMMLDGGGSTSLVINGHRVNELPAGSGERVVANHLAIVPA